MEGCARAENDGEKDVHDQAGRDVVAGVVGLVLGICWEDRGLADQGSILTLFLLIEQTPFERQVLGGGFGAGWGWGRVD